MRVLVVAHAFPPEAAGGTERYAQFAAEGLVDLGHEVEVFCGSLEWREEFEVHESCVGRLPITRVHRDDLYFDHWDKIQCPRVAAEFEKLLDRFRPEVIHQHHWIRLSLDLVRRSAAKGIPTVLHLHDLFVTCPRVFRIDAEDGACELPQVVQSCLHCVPRWEFQKDAEIAASLRQYAGLVQTELTAATRRLAPTRSHADYLVSQRASVSPVGVLSHPDLRVSGWQGRSAESPSGRLRVLFFSHLNPIKGAHILLEALGRLGSSGGGVELDLFGEVATDSYGARLRELAEGMPVRFHGAYRGDEPMAVSADVVAVPSLARESHSFWLDEALRSGLPIVASRLGALEERAGGRAQLVPAGDVMAWAGALAELRDDLSLRGRLAAAPAALPTSQADHLQALEGELAAAVASGPPRVRRPPEPAELEPEWQRREWAFRELLRSQGWERLLGEASAELETLRGGAASADEDQGEPESPG